MARAGVSWSEGPITSSFCAHVLRGFGVLWVADALLDARFADDPLVVEKPHVRFYAGAPLKLDDVHIGTLYVLDDQPRRSLSSLQEDYLTYLADRTILALKIRQSG